MGIFTVDYRGLFIALCLVTRFCILTTMIHVIKLLTCETTQLIK